MPGPLLYQAAVRQAAARKKAAPAPLAYGSIAIKGRMRKLILLIALLPGLAVANELPTNGQPKSALPKSAPPKTKAPRAAVNPCAQYGAGFVQVQGTNTCVKTNGYIRTDVGASGGAR